MARHLLVVQTNPVEGREDEYNEWYDTVHLGEVLEVPGFVAAQRFRVSGTMPGNPMPEHRYLALYELETDDLDATLAGLRSAARTMSISTAIDRSTAQSFVVAPIGERVTEVVADG